MGKHLNNKVYIIAGIVLILICAAMIVLSFMTGTVNTNTATYVVLIVAGCALLGAGIKNRKEDSKKDSSQDIGDHQHIFAEFDEIIHGHMYGNISPYVQI